MSIEEILKNIPDKSAYRTTTSHKFKRDVFEFFNADEYKERHCVEWGSHVGYTTYVLSYLFKTVTGSNLNRADEARLFNNARQNVTFYTQDIYRVSSPINVGDVFLVDADHSYDAVIADVLRSLTFKSAGKKYFIFDDYGGTPDVKLAIDALILSDKIELIKKIGHNVGDPFILKLHDSEGVICKEI